MRFASFVLFRLFAALLLCALVNAQQAAMQSSTSVPRLVSYAGRAVDAQGKPIAGTVGATFAIYKEQNEGAPLWLETQNIKTDAKGNYSVQLGATKQEGLPLELFSAGESRWLGVRLNGGEEQARVLLLSVPYALKAADAETVGGLPASAFLLAAAAGNANATATAGSMAANSSSASVPPPVSGTGATDFVPLWLNTTGSLGNSVLFQSGTGATAKMGINMTTPASTLDVAGGTTVRGTLSLPASGNATAAVGKNSQPMNLAASVFNKTTGTPVRQAFQWQAEPVGNNTTTATGSLNLLYASGGNAMAETGLKVGPNGRITFAAGQTFPGTGPGTVKSVGLAAPASDFTVSGSPVTSSGTLGLSWTVTPTSANTANAIVKRDSTGSFSAGSITATSSNSGGTGLYAYAGSSVGSNGVVASGATGVAGYTTVNGSIAVYGNAGNSTGSNGVVGYGATGVAGNSTITGSYGTFGNGSTGVWGNGNGTGANVGVSGTSSGGTGVTGTGVNGVIGSSSSSAGIGMGAYNSSTGDAFFAENQSGGFAGFFLGDVDVDGNLSKAGGSFKIDHPLDPANKYLYHSFVESPDMMNIYNGNVTTDAQGNAMVHLPAWFETLNRDFRYQLTVLGQFSQAIVASKVANHQFAIKTDKPNVEVSWQVTGIRQDAWANTHRIPVEVSKPESERGSYLHPELFGAPAEKSIAAVRHPMQKLLKEKAATLPTTTK
jgi:trimeric autotransporter adhesin